MSLYQGQGFNPLQGNRLKADDQIDPPVGQFVLQLVGVALEQRKFHHGELLPEAGQDLGQQGQTAGVGNPQPQHAHIVAADVPHLGEILGMQIQNLSCGVYQQLSCISQRQLGGAGEQFHVQLPLHIGDVVGQGLLGNI